MRQTTRTTTLGTFVLTRHDSAQEFFCRRCDRGKKAKNIIAWTNSEGETKTICNGCQGFLLAQGG